MVRKTTGGVLVREAPALELTNGTLAGERTSTVTW